MTLLIFLLVLILIISIYNFYPCDQNEGFDEKITSATLENCTRFCKMTANCSGFSYDDKNNLCYPSVTPILGRPGSSIYKDKYSSRLKTCNKTFAIKNPMNESADNIKRPNAIYRCSEPEKEDYFLMHNQDKLAQINLKSANNNKFNDYPIKPYLWPNDSDLVLAPVDWENLKSIYNIKDNSIDIVNAHQLNPNAGFLTTFKRSDQMSTGKYYKHYQCIDDIPLSECLDYCANKNECKGVEFNPSFIKDNILYHNVCCPKSSIGELISRPSKYNKGNFYIKESKHRNNLDHDNDIHIIV